MTWSGIASLSMVIIRSCPYLRLDEIFKFSFCFCVNNSNFVSFFFVDLLVLLLFCLCVKNILNFLTTHFNNLIHISLHVCTHRRKVCEPVIIGNNSTPSVDQIFLSLSTSRIVSEISDSQILFSTSPYTSQQHNKYLERKDLKCGMSSRVIQTKRHPVSNN